MEGFYFPSKTSIAPDGMPSDDDPIDDEQRAEHKRKLKFNQGIGLQESGTSYSKSYARYADPVEIQSCHGLHGFRGTYGAYDEQVGDSSMGRATGHVLSSRRDESL